MLSKPLSIVDSVMPSRCAWRGVGAEAEQVATRERFTMLVVLTAWKWSMSKTSSSKTSSSKRKKKPRYMFNHSLIHLLTRSRTHPCVRRRTADDRVELVGRRVCMMGSVWSGQDPEAKFYGLVRKRVRYKGRKGEMVNGYEVLWEDGEKERWPYEYLHVALVPLEDQLLSDSDSDDGDSDVDDSDSDNSDEDDSEDLFDVMTERDDPEDFEYREMFSTSHTGEDIVTPADC